MYELKRYFVHDGIILLFVVIESQLFGFEELFMNCVTF